MNLSPIHSLENLDSLRKLPVLAIDLGFASAARSCGLSGAQSPLTFADAIQATVDWINGLGANEAVLILEAPLSGAFSMEGNPMPRGGFETHHDRGHANRRCWNEGPGAAMAFAALHFLRKALEETEGKNLTVHLLEGFASRYGAPQPKHSHVASWLEDAWESGRFRNKKIDPIAPGGHHFISITEFLGHGESHESPWILRLPDGLSIPPANHRSGT